MANTQSIQTALRLHKLTHTQRELQKKVIKLERINAESFKQIFQMIKILVEHNKTKRSAIGFRVK